jgi:streptogramin lyase
VGTAAPVFVNCPSPTLDLGCNPAGLPECDATVAATSSCGLTPAPQTLLASSPGGNSVKQYDGTTGAFITTFASGSGLVTPAGVTIGPDGNLYVSSVGNNSVKRFDGTTGAFLSTFVLSASGGLSVPDGLVFGPGTSPNLYVSSSRSNTVNVYIGASGAFITNCISLTNSVLNGGLTNPAGLVFGVDGNLYVCSRGDNTVKRYQPATPIYSPTPGTNTSLAFVANFVTAGSGGLANPAGLAFGPDGSLYVSSTGDNTVKRYNGATGAFLGNFVAAGSGGLGSPAGLVFGPDNNLYVSSASTGQVLRYNGSSGAFIDIFVASGNGLSGRSWLVFTPTLPFNQQIQVTCTKVDTSNGCAHTRTLTYTAVDPCGHTSTCSQVVTWKDAITLANCPAPTLTLPCNPAVIPDCTSYNVSAITTSASCPATVSCGHVDAANGCAHTRTLTYLATDTCGHTNTCTQVITWSTDIDVPVFTVCPTNMDLGSNPATIPDCDTSPGNVQATDACGVLITCASADTTNGCAFTRTITYTATDVCGNTNTCTQVITWTQGPAPVLSVVLQGSNVVLSWPITCNTFVLQQTTDLTSPITWSPAGGTVVDVGGNHTVTLPLSGGNTFFRLKFP